MCVAEYVLLSIPILTILTLYGQWINTLFLIALCFLIPTLYHTIGLNSVSPVFKLLFNPFGSTGSFNLNFKVPIKNPISFEWISGIRRYALIIIPVYIVVLAFSYKAFIAPVGIVILSLITSGFYYYGEPREFIEIFFASCKRFILQKVSVSMQYLSVMLSPIVLIALVFQLHTWYYIIGAFIIAFIIQLITIVFKYALFAENADLGRNGILVSINILCALVPFLWPLPIIMGVKYYVKAQNNLKEYLHDINH